MVGLSVASVALVYAAGAALLGLWVVARFPARGPQTIASSVVTVAWSYLLLRLSARLTGAAADSAGPSVALTCVFLPIMTTVFWSAAHLIRTAAERIAPFRR